MIYCRGIQTPHLSCSIYGLTLHPKVPQLAPAHKLCKSNALFVVCFDGDPGGGFLACLCPNILKEWGDSQELVTVLPHAAHFPLFLSSGSFRVRKVHVASNVTSGFATNSHQLLHHHIQRSRSVSDTGYHEDPPGFNRSLWSRHKSCHQLLQHPVQSWKPVPIRAVGSSFTYGVYSYDYF